MSTLDYGTLQIASIISRVAFVLVFIITLLRNPREHYFGIWAGALVCSLTASFITVRDVPTLPLEIVKGVVVYTLYGASLATSWAGLRLFYERAVAPAQVAMLSLGPGLIYGVMLSQGLLNWGMKAVFASIAVSTGLCIIEILRTPTRNHLWTQYIVLAGFIGYFAAFILSIAIVQFGADRLASPETGIYSLLFDQWCGVLIQVGYLAMVSERAQLKLSLLAETDALTGLANRRGLFAALGRRISMRGGVRGATLLIDIDHFKSINDTNGHENGDRVLVDFAERLQSVVRAENVVARWGGEEFLIVLGQADGVAAMATAERLRAAVVGRPFPLDRGAIIVTASIGVSVTAEDEANIDAAVARADAALYAAKSGGRDRVVLKLPAPPRQNVGARQAEQPSGLRSAVESIHAAGRPRSEFG